MSVTERIRLDGEPVSQEKSAAYFWPVFDAVCRGKAKEERPPYFQVVLRLRTFT